MKITNNYIDFIIDNHFFYIKELSFKPIRNNSAENTLKKIDDILTKGLIYHNQNTPEFSKLSDENITTFLKQKTEQIYQGYQKKYQGCWNLLPNKWKGLCSPAANRIDDIYHRIINHLHPAEIFPLPNELVQEITKHLNLYDLKNLAQVNKHAKAHAVAALIRRARTWGFEGMEEQAARLYIKQLHAEVYAFARTRFQKIDPSNWLAIKTSRPTLDCETILEKLSMATTPEIFTILSDKKIFTAFKNFRKFLQQNRKFKITAVDAETARLGHAAMLLATEYKEPQIRELLIKHGVELRCERPIDFTQSTNQKA